MIALQWSLSLRAQRHICLSPLWSQLSYWPLGYYLLLSSKEWSLFVLHIFPLPASFSPPFQEWSKWITWFFPLFFTLLRTCSFNPLGISWCSTFSSLKLHDRFAGRFRSIFGSVTAKIAMQSASPGIRLGMSGLTLAFQIFLIIFPKWLKNLFWPWTSLIFLYVAVPSTNSQEILVLHGVLCIFLCALLYSVLEDAGSEKDALITNTFLAWNRSACSCSIFTHSALWIGFSHCVLAIHSLLFGVEFPFWSTCLGWKHSWRVGEPNTSVDRSVRGSLH